jgi:ADP-heptose:LPS heptosyltransferase/glycosyltransferase involved in cell wall biosynthesis
MKILIIKTCALGDVLRTNFIAQGLKEKFGQSTIISWMTSEGALSLLKNNPFIDEIFLEKNREKLINRKFDIAINLEEDLENVSFATHLNTKEKIGFVLKNGKIVPTKTAKSWFNMSLLGKSPQNDILKRENKRTHNQIISDLVKIPSEKYEPRLELGSKQKNFAKNFAKKNGLNKSDKVIGVNVGSSGRWKKGLPVKKTTALINRLSKKLDVKIILFGGPEEVERNKKIISLVSCPLIDAGCDNSLEEYIAIVGLCKLVIVTDTLGLHISLALKRKTIALVGPTSTSELGMYNLGVKINPNSSCLCCYDPQCDSMQKMDVAKILRVTKKLLLEKVVFLITSFKEPETIGAAIEHALNQTTDHPYEILVAAPDKETIEVVKKYQRKYKNVKLFKDPGRGKSFALNLIFKNIDADIIILTDGEVAVNNVAIEKILKSFENPFVGCLTGRPVTQENRKTKYGYWANFLFDAAHGMRARSYSKESFLECSGYLFAFRKKHVYQIPTNVAEDTVIPYMFWERGYKIGYVSDAEVSVKSASNWGDWISQKTRTSKAHETLDLYVNTALTKREKTFTAEIKKGIFQLVSYPKNLVEAWWTIELMFARLYMWLKVHFDTKIISKNYSDGWDRIDSTK